MAKLDKLEVTISSGGRVLPEYNVDPSGIEVHEAAHAGNAPTIVKYIESTPGVEFAMNCKVLKGQKFGKADQIAFYTFCDGKHLGGQVFSRSSVKSTKPQFYTQRSTKYTVDGSQWLEKCSCWKELQTTDEAPSNSARDTQKNYGELGIIRIVARRQKCLGPVDCSGYSGVMETPIPEKALKGQAINSIVGHGPAVSVSKRTFVAGNNIEQHPLAVFVFLYRTKHGLQTLGVIPRTPSPIPLEQRDVNTLSVEELKELVTRQQAELTLSRQQIETKVKKETVSGNGNQMTINGLKREASGPDNGDDDDIVLVRSEKKPRIESETIDLCD